MSIKTKTLAKSLHTVTALIATARYVLKHGPAFTLKTNAQAMEEALELLGYAGAADPYGLAARALKTMNDEDAAKAAPALELAA